MDYLNGIAFIIEELKRNGFEIEYQEVIKLRDNTFSSSELLMSVTHDLLKMIKNKNVNKNISDKVIELKKYCWSIGLLVNG